MRSQPGGMRFLVLVMLGVLVALAAAVSVTFLVQAPTPDTVASGQEIPAQLELVEEPTEALANTLLDCSVAIRAGNRRRMADCFAPALVATPFPATAAELKPAVRWFLRHAWEVEAGPRELSRQEIMESLEVFLKHFDTLEDVRLKVKQSEVTDDAGTSIDAKVKLTLVGRDEQGRREWVQGEAKVIAGKAADEPWRIENFEITHLESMVAKRDLFSEVSMPAGMDAQDPPLLEHPSLGLAAYGAAAADVDNDGLLDVFATGASGNVLFLNNGDGTFRDAALQAWIQPLPTPGVAPLFLDFDNDGDADLFITTIGEQFLFENRLLPEGRLVFRDISLQAGVHRHAVGYSAAAGDVNGDGLPDVYVASYNLYGQVLPDSWESGTNGTPNLLFVNQGDGTFKEQAEEWGVADSRWSYAASFVDVDEDGALDLYVANDFGGGNPLYMNQGGRFVDAALERGVLDQGYGMGVSFGDFDNDGDLDLHVTKMSSTAGRRILTRVGSGQVPTKSRLQELAAGNSLYENVGDGFFRDVSHAAGPFPGGWAWGGGFVDFDNDGWLDLHTPNGFLSGKSMRDT